MARPVIAVLALAGIVAAGSGAALNDTARTASHPASDLRDGLIVAQRSDCGLDGLDPATGRSVSLAPGFADCPNAMEQEGPLIFSYDAVAATNDLRTIVYARRVGCGSHDCEVSPTEPIVADTGVYLTDPWSGKTERLDDCARPDCRNGDVAVSSDGRRVAFEEHYPGPWSVENPRQGTLVLLDRSSGEQHRLADGALARDLRWSPDGQDLAFVSSSGPLRPPRLEVVSADGTGRRVVGDGPGVFAFAWSTDGRSLLLLSNGAAGSDTTLIRRVDLEATTDTVLTTLGPGWGILAPDGSSYAYIDTQGSLWLESIDSGISRRLFTATHATALPLAWSGDGSRLLYGTRQDDLSEFFIVGIEPTASPRALPMDARPLGWIPG